MAWRNSAVWMTGGMMASVGFVWLGHALKGRLPKRPKAIGGSPERWARLEEKADEIVRDEVLGRTLPVASAAAAPSDDYVAQLADVFGADEPSTGERETRPDASARTARDGVSDDAARDDALRDIRAESYSDPNIEIGEAAESLSFDADSGVEDAPLSGDRGLDELDIDIDFEDTRRDPQEVEWPQSNEMVGQNQHFTPPDEPYDAMDPEDVGTEWLNRATETMPIEGRDPLNALEGTNVIDISDDDLSLVEERNFGADQEGEPMDEYAGTNDEDVAARLPVGNIDENGNVELHSPVTPPDAFNAPPTGELSSSEDELARRAAASEAARRQRR